MKYPGVNNRGVLLPPASGLKNEGRELPGPLRKLYGEGCPVCCSLGGSQGNMNLDILIAPGQKPEGKGVSLHSLPSQHRASWRQTNGSGGANRKRPA